MRVVSVGKNFDPMRKDLGTSLGPCSTIHPVQVRLPVEPCRGPRHNRGCLHRPLVNDQCPGSGIHSPASPNRPTCSSASWRGLVSSLWGAWWGSFVAPFDVAPARWSMAPMCTNEAASPSTARCTSGQFVSDWPTNLPLLPPCSMRCRRRRACMHSPSCLAPPTTTRHAFLVGGRQLPPRLPNHAVPIRSRTLARVHLFCKLPSMRRTLVSVVVGTALGRRVVGQVAALHTRAMRQFRRCQSTNRCWLWWRHRS